MVWTLVAEMLGTGFLVLGYNLGGTANCIPVTMGLTCFMMTQIFEPIGGVHFNPAITLAMALKMRHSDDARHCTFKFVILEIIAQICGAIFGCAGSMVTMQLAPPSTKSELAQ